MVIFDLAKQVAQYFSSARFQDLVEADSRLQVSASVHVTKEFQLKDLQQDAQDMCCKLFEKVYSVFVSHFKTKIYPALSRIFSDLPKPLTADDLEFAMGDNEEEEEEKRSEDSPQTFTEKLDAWKQMHSEELFYEFIPQCVAEFNTDFANILEKMTIENLVVVKVVESKNEAKSQWI